MTRRHRIGLAVVVVAALASWIGGSISAAHAQSGTGTIGSSIWLAFSGTSTITVGDHASLYGFLTFSDGSSSAGFVVRVTRTNPDHTETAVGDVTTTSDQGGFNFVDSPPARGTYTYTATFDGDTQRSSATATSDVLTVSGVATTVGLHTSATKINYRHSVNLTAHLSAHGTNPTVSIFKTPAGGARMLVRSAPVDADGNLTVSVRPRKTTTFDAVYTGDEVFKPATSPTVKVAVRVAIAGALSRYYTTSRTYRLYHYSPSCVTSGVRCPRYTVSVAPNHAGDKVSIMLAYHTTSGWVVVGREAARLNSRSRVRIILRYANRTIVGQRYRLEAHFAADAANAANTTGWSHFRVTT
jgi:hypothetical protein